MLACASTLPAQLNLQLAFRFVDPQAGGHGTIGITQDDRQFRYYVVAFTNLLPIHEFTAGGNFTSQWAPACATTPDDVAYDPLTDHLWLLDTDTPTSVVETDRAGNCIRAWPLASPTPSPVGIMHERNTDTLWISSTGYVSQWSKAGQRLPGGFAFQPPGGGALLAGITHDLINDHFYLVSSGGQKVYEVTKAGVLVATMDLAPFGVVNAQGIHYSVGLQQLAIVDNSLATVFVFRTGRCAGSIAQKGQGCQDPKGTVLSLGISGCPDLGRTLSVNLATSATSTIPVSFLLGASDTFGLGTTLPIDLGPLGAPGCRLYTSSDLAFGPIPNAGGGNSLLLSVPNDAALKGQSVFWQGVQLHAQIPTFLPVVTSGYLVMTFG